MILAREAASRGGDPRELYGIERTMVETAVFTYGLLASFVLSAASHNQRAQRPNPPVMNYIGFVLLGMSAAAAVLLTGYAVWQLI